MPKGNLLPQIPKSCFGKRRLQISASWVCAPRPVQGPVEAGSFILSSGDGTGDSQLAFLFALANLVILHISFLWLFMIGVQQVDFLYFCVFSYGHSH